MKLSKYIIYSEKLKLQTTNGVVQLIYSTRTNKILSLEIEKWEQVLKNQLPNIEDNILKELIEKEIIIPENENELNTIIQQNISYSEDKEQLYIVIQPTANCNLGCWYCGQNHTKSKLGQDDIFKLTNLIELKLSQNRNYKELHIAWFGGEPFLALNEIKSITLKLRTYCDQNGISYFSKIVTNGLTAKPQIVKDLVDDLKLNRIEITIDGLKESHDANRYRKNGQGSFDVIYSNILGIANLNIPNLKLTIRCNVSIKNYDVIDELIDKLYSDNLQDKILFYLAPVHSWGNDAHLSSLSTIDFSTFEIQWLIKLYNLGFSINLLPDRKKEVCLTASPNSVVIDAYGSTHKCSEVSYVDNYNNTEIGELFKISNEIDSKDKMEPINTFYKNLKNEEYTCHKCRIFPICGGSCPKEWLEGHIPCPPIKYNIEERILVAVANLNKSL